MGMNSDFHGGDVLIAGPLSADDLMRDLGLSRLYEDGSPLRRLYHDRLFCRISPHYWKAGFPALFPEAKWDFRFGTDAPWDDESRVAWTAAFGKFLRGLHDHPGVADWLVRTDESHIVGYWIDGVAVVNTHLDEPLLAFRELFGFEMLEVFAERSITPKLVDLGGTYQGERGV